jgi:hypothetical protein
MLNGEEKNCLPNINIAEDNIHFQNGRIETEPCRSAFYLDRVSLSDLEKKDYPCPKTEFSGGDSSNRRRGAEAAIAILIFQ